MSLEISPHHSIDGIRFLLALHSNYDPILYSYWDI